MADIFDVVADPTRRDLLVRLHALGRGNGTRSEASVGELVAATGISQPTVSKHLKTLREHGLVQVREEGQHRYYRLDPQPLDEVRGWLDGLASAPPVSEREGERFPIVSAASVDWAGTEVGDRLGRAAASTAHGARTVWERIPGVGRH